MDLERIKQILALVREHDLAELEIEEGGVRLKVRKHGSSVFQATSPAAGHDSGAVVPPLRPPVLAAPSVTAALSPERTDDEGELVVKSPIVGTFYRSAEPGAAAFVEIGSLVKKGQVLCIIEAMKLMNEIDSEYDGEISSIFVENGQPVQYGDRLFAIKPR
jgi:acetyl-CoA carboxylase biotin carboxyl carrier protein